MMLAVLAAVLIVMGGNDLAAPITVVHEVSTDNRYWYSFGGVLTERISLLEPIPPSVDTTLIVQPESPVLGCMRPRSLYLHRNTSDLHAPAAAILSVKEADSMLRRLLR